MDEIINEIRSTARRKAFRILSGILPGNTDLLPEAEQIADLAVLEAQNVCQNDGNKNLGRVTLGFVNRLINECYADPFYESRNILISSSDCAEEISRVLGQDLPGTFTQIKISYLQRKEINRILRSHKYDVAILGNIIKARIHNKGMAINGRIRFYAKNAVPVDFDIKYSDPIDSVIEDRSYTAWIDSQIESEPIPTDPAPLLQLMQCIMHLSPLRRKILINYYGLWGCERLTSSELASKLGITNRNIRYQRDEGLKELRRIMASSDTLSSQEGYDESDETKHCAQ